MPSSAPDPAATTPSKRGPVIRALLLIGVIVAWLAIAGVGGTAIGKLSQVSTNDQETFLPRGVESVQAADELRKFNETDALPAFLVLDGKAAYDEAFPGGAGAPAGAPSGAPTGPPPGAPTGPPPGTPTDGPPGGPGGPPGAEFAASIVDAATVEGEPLTDFLAEGETPVAIPANENDAVLVIVPLDAEKVYETNADNERVVTLVVAALRDAGEQTSADAVHVTGPAGFTADLTTAFAGIDGVLLLVTLSVVLVILLIVYRSAALPIMVLFSSVSGLALAGLVVYQLAKNDVIVLSGQTQGILSILVIGAATDYSLLIVARYREELQKEESTWLAMRRTWRACIEPIAASAATVIAGLLCLLLSDLNSNRGLGPVGSIGIAAAFLVSLTLLPAFLLLGRWVFWPRIPRPGVTHGKPTSSGLWARIANLVERRARPVWITVAAVLIALCFAVPTLKADGTPQAELFLTQSDAVDGSELLAEKFEDGAATPIEIVAPQGDAAEIAAAVEKVPDVNSVSVGERVVDGEVIVSVAPADPERAWPVVEDIRDTIAPISDDALVGGAAALQLDTKDTAQHDLWLIIPVILVVVLLILMLLLRSIIAPLMLVVATVVSFGSAVGVAALLFNNVFGFESGNPEVPLLGFVFLVALGVDYSIFLMTRAREEVIHLGPTDGVTKALRVTGGVITSAGIVLAATFAALAVIPLTFMAQMAFIVSFGVLLDTLIVRTLLVPALAIDVGRFTWWPSKLSRSGTP